MMLLDWKFFVFSIFTEKRYLPLETAKTENGSGRFFRFGGVTTQSNREE